MNENSPIWLRPAATTSDVRPGYGNRKPITIVMRPLPTTTSVERRMTSRQWPATYTGLTSMPTDTKNSTAKASRNGRRSALTWWLNGDWPMRTPARNAPRARETPKNAADASAVPTAADSATSTKSSRDPVRTTRAITAGTTRGPSVSMSTTKRSAFATAQSGVCHDSSVPVVARSGSITRSTTVARSSSTSHPTATRPCSVLSSPLSMRPRSRTTVLATEMAAPTTSAAGAVAPNDRRSR